MAALAAMSSADAAYPDHAVRWIVPVGSGGAFDLLARALAPILGRNLGVPVEVENIPGPEGYRQIYAAKPDGYTIGMASPSGEFVQAVISPPSYKFDDMTWLGQITGAVNLVVASKPSGIASFAQMRAAQRPLRFASFNLGPPLVQMVLLAHATGFKLTRVNFKSPGEFVAGLVRGEADVGSLGLQTLLKPVMAGDLVPLLVWDTKPDSRAPGVPTLADIGHPELALILNHRSVIAPPHVPDDIKSVLIAAFRKTVEEGDGLAYLKAQKFELNAIWGAAFEATIARLRQAIETYAPVLRAIPAQ
jgi:tripartite-type tricarboxylate transporter receptor subunit TctC